MFPQTAPVSIRTDAMKSRGFRALEQPVQAAPLAFDSRECSAMAPRTVRKPDGKSCPAAIAESISGVYGAII
jgi:hypothetical protein